MRPLEASDILRLWETCGRLHPIDRALTMVGAACPEDPPEALARLPIGERERRAAALRMRSFGPRSAGACECPECGLELEIDAPLAEILAAPATDCEPFTVTIDDLELLVRTPDSRDQAALTRCPDDAAALRQLVDRCVIAAARDGVATVEPLTDVAVAELAAALAAHDTNAETLIALRCVRCDHAWTLLFDAGEFLWREVAARARRLLFEVHTLARTYGWHETEILGMTARRREAYLDLGGA